jgi:ATP-dependent exoDNAse (exonuclease V) beta subunit
VGTVMRSLRNFFQSPVLQEALAVGRANWLTIEDLVSFEVGSVPVFLRMDLAFRDREGRVVIVDWKTGRGEGRFNEIQLAGYALYAARQG